MAGESCAALDVLVPGDTCQYTHAQLRSLTFASGSVQLRSRTVVAAVLFQPHMCNTARVSKHAASELSAPIDSQCSNLSHIVSYCVLTAVSLSSSINLFTFRFDKLFQVQLSFLLPKKNSRVWVRERTIPTERPPLVGEVIANFCG
jgi:hypothetical protein